ncbi:hypothetical protein BGX34_012163 [Mortierella sp. NVP85]|nr:hypothetical protein BGX34_012163 [Mortierella sp. NVP85]
MDSENSPDPNPSELDKTVQETPGTAQTEELESGQEGNRNAYNTTKSTAPNVIPPEPTASLMETMQPSLLISSNSTSGHPPYNWELLPKKELERIAYNSRKQRKARLRISHGEISEGSGSFSIAPSTPATPHTIDNTVKDSHQKDTKRLESSELGRNSGSLSEFSISANKECTHDRNSTLTDGHAMSDKSNIIVSRSAKQRRRKAERDRKRARARLIGETDQIKRDVLEVRNLKQLDLNQNPQKHEVIDDNPTTTLCSKDFECHEACSSMNFGKSRSHAVLPLDDHLRMGIQKNTLTPRSDIPTLTTSGIPSTSTINEHTSTTTKNSEVKETVDAQSRSTRLCSICGSSWKTMKCWEGHLLSAQHSRHLLRTMQLTAPPIPPCGKTSVLASMDPFGWGAGTGVIETDENEDSVMNIDKNSDQNIQAVAYQ